MKVDHDNPPVQKAVVSLVESGAPSSTARQSMQELMCPNSELYKGDTEAIVKVQSNLPILPFIHCPPTLSTQTHLSL